MGKAQQWSDSPRLVRMYRFVIKWSVPQQKSNTTHIPPFPFSPSLHLMPLLLDLWLSDSFEKITSHCCFPSASLASPFCPPPPSFFFLLLTFMPNLRGEAGRQGWDGIRLSFVNSIPVLTLWGNSRSEVLGDLGWSSSAPFPPSVSETISCVCNISHTTAVFKFS